MKKKPDLRMDAYISALLVIRGPSRGADLLDHLLSTIVEPIEAKHAVYEMAQALSRMGLNDTVVNEPNDEGEHVWSMAPEEMNIWCTDRLNLKDGPENNS